MTKHAIASSLVGHTQYVGGCLFAPRSHLLATSSWDDTLRLWDASLGRPLVTMKQAQVLGFSPDGNRLAVRLGESELALAEIAHADSYQVLNPEMIGNRSHEDTLARRGPQRHLQPGRPTAGNRAARKAFTCITPSRALIWVISRPGPAKRSSSTMPAGNLISGGRLGLLPLADPAVASHVERNGRGS